MAKPIQLSNGRVWPTQTAALQHFKSMLARYQDNEFVEDRQDHEDLVALLERYDLSITDGPPKIGAGIDRFQRRLNIGDGYTSSSFWVHRVEGEPTDFSYRTAVTGQPKGDAREFVDACRAAVQSSLHAAKNRFFVDYADVNGRVPCDLTGELLLFHEAHVDHAWPTFGQIVATFRAARGWANAIPPNVVSIPSDAQTHATFVDVEVARHFTEFHHAVAELRILARRTNLSMAAGQRRPKVKRPVKL